MRAAYPDGIEIDTPDYVDVFAFLDSEGCSHRAVATAMEFAFDVDYYAVMASWPQTAEWPLPAAIQRAESRLAPHGLDEWRAEPA
ncbi:MAG: hypothetical protein AAF802_20080 [Planctomycetota bacterium]